MPALRFCFFSFLISVLVACDPPSKPSSKSTTPSPVNEKRLSDQFVEANKQLMQKENDIFDYYVRSHKMPFKRTGSGIRYYVYKPSDKGDSLRAGMQVTLGYEIRLLDGTLCYSSDVTGKRTFVIGEENIESGIHKGLQYLKRGDQALLLIPSPLAHGLLGDQNKIPPQTPILYDVKVD